MVWASVFLSRLSMVGLAVGSAGLDGFGSAALDGFVSTGLDGFGAAAELALQSPRPSTLS